MIYKLKLILSYLGISTFVGTFSYVYLTFVPGVFNLWMVGAFSVPLIAGIFEIVFAKNMNPKHPIRVSLFRLAVATLTVQVILRGIYEIALTNFRGEIIFVIAWALLILTSFSVKE